MKKIFFVLTIGLTVGCGITQPTSYGNSCLIKHSDVLISACDTSTVYIIKNSTGDLIAERWVEGHYGTKTQVVRLDSTDFIRLAKKSEPCTCWMTAKD